MHATVVGDGDVAAVVAAAAVVAVDDYVVDDGGAVNEMLLIWKYCAAQNPPVLCYWRVKPFRARTKTTGDSR